MSEYQQPCQFCIAQKERLDRLEDAMTSNQDKLDKNLTRIHDKIDENQKLNANRLPVWGTTIVTILTMLASVAITFALK